MKGKKFRYDEKKLSKKSALKKQIALILANNDVKGATTVEGQSIAEIMAFGLKSRPYVSLSDKELVKRFDELYAMKSQMLSDYKEEKSSTKKSTDYWYADSNISKLEKEIKEMQPIIDELIEEAFSS